MERLKSTQWAIPQAATRVLRVGGKINVEPYNSQATSERAYIATGVN